MSAIRTQPWIKITTTFTQHPKIMRVSKPARMTLIEMIAYSREYELDGVIPGDVGADKWGERLVDAVSTWDVQRYGYPLRDKTGRPVEELTILDELENNDDTHPSVTRNEAGDYVITNYAKYQQTRADLNKRRAAGKKAGKASATKRTTTRKETP